MENKDLQVRTFLNANGTPFYPKTRWSAIIDAPDIEGVISDILVEGNYVSDANYVHTDNNFTNVLKSKLDNLQQETFNLYATYNGEQLIWDSYLNPSFRDIQIRVTEQGLKCVLRVFWPLQSYNTWLEFHLKEVENMQYFLFSHIEKVVGEEKIREIVIRINRFEDTPTSSQFTISFNDFEIPEDTGNVLVVTAEYYSYIAGNVRNQSHNFTEIKEAFDDGKTVILNFKIGGGITCLLCWYCTNSEITFLNFDGQTSNVIEQGKITVSSSNAWNYSYELFDTLPLQTENNGKFLTTNGSSASWSDIGLSNISDIYIDNLSNNQILKYNSSQQRWENAANTAASAISQLTDVELTNLADGQILKYSSQDSKWVNATGGSGGSVQSDWNETDTDDPAYIKNKPTIPSGTVTSVGVSVPTGLSVSDTPVTSSGTIAISFASGYSIPTTVKQGEWDAKQSAIDSTHKLSADYIEDGTTNKVINVKPDWNAASGADAEILNKPAIHNIPAGGNAGQVLKKTSATDYDVNWANASETLPSAYCTTSGSTAAKKANCSLYVTQANQYLQVLIGSANTYQGALTLNINSAGDKPIYINGTVSSSSNYTLPNGTYFVFYDGTNYYFRTDGKLPMKDAAFGGSYNDLANKPTIPDAVSGTDDGTNWTSITIGSNTKAIPSGGGGSSTLSGLTDTSITTPANGEVLKYNSTSSKWENSNEIQADYQQMNNTAADYIKNAPLVRIYRSVTGTAAVTTPAESYTGAKYDVTDNTITSYVDGMVVCIKVPVVGNGSYGTGLQINSLGYKPIVYNVNTMITNRYSVGSVIWAVYNDSQGAVFYDAGTKYTVTGCWQVMDYNADTTAPYNLTRYNGTRLVSANLYRYVLLLRKDLTTLIPIHSVVGTSPAATTATTKTMTTESFDPFGEIYYYPTSEEVTAGNAVAMSALYTQKSAVDGRYIFNSGKTLTANKEIYLVMDLQSDGKAKLASTAWSQTLPSTNDGHLYKLLGYTYDSYRFELYNYHPIYYYDGTQLRQYTGAAIPDAVSGTNDGTNWTTLTIGSVTKNIPSGGGGGLTNYDFTELSTPTISSGATTITFAANQRNGVELSTNADLAIALVSNNKSDNYIWITNSHSTDDIDVTFSSISFGATTINDVIGTDSLPTIAHGETLEIGIYVTNSKARITSRIL